MELLKNLCFLNCCSGNEKKVAELIINQIFEFVDEIRIDALGNVIAHKRGNDKKIMLLTHMDESGFFATISNDKDIKVSKIGDVNTKSIGSQMIEFENGISAVFTGDNSENISDFSVDSLSDKKIDFTGLTAVFSAEYKEIGDKIYAKALIDRVGCYSLIKLIQSVNTGYDMYYVFTVKKHIGMKGAKVAAYDISPDISVVIDCFKNCESKDSDTFVIVKDKAYISDVNIKNSLISSGFTPIVLKNEKSEASVIQTNGNGVAVASVGIGFKYVLDNNVGICLKDSINKLVTNLKIFVEGNI